MAPGDRQDLPRHPVRVVGRIDESEVVDEAEFARIMKQAQEKVSR